MQLSQQIRHISIIGEGPGQSEPERALAHAGFDCTTFAAPDDLRASEERHSSDVIIATLSPQCSDDYISQLGRLATGTGSLLVITPIEAREQRIKALQQGAEDFLISPLRTDELLARVDALCYRLRNSSESVLVGGPIALDTSRHRASRDGKALTLTPTELRLLEILIKNKNRTVTRQKLCEHLWSPNWTGVTNVIEVHINRLRQKVEQPETPRLIHTVRGSGYSFRHGT
ncbi:MAG: hypothetical protein Aurels2KO_17210 [Aureliella sp.]